MYVYTCTASNGVNCSFFYNITSYSWMEDYCYNMYIHICCALRMLADLVISLSIQAHLITSITVETTQIPTVLRVCLLCNRMGTLAPIFPLTVQCYSWSDTVSKYVNSSWSVLLIWSGMYICWCVYYVVIALVLPLCSCQKAGHIKLGSLLIVSDSQHPAMRLAEAVPLWLAKSWNCVLLLPLLSSHWRY